MSVEQIKIPDIGDFDSVDVIEVLVSEGDVVAVDDSLLTLESDKATMEIPSPFSGKVTKVSVSVGDKVSEGTYVLDIEVSGEAAASAPVAESKPAPADKTSEKAPEKAAEPTPA
ncbi:branched-chain alpha-keto acid dehydrogenase subunit E2, partial [Thioclava sp. JE_KL1]|nr:branched-chain alpha-keto acid dehydrogenase subunit E2 [Thioclava sp. JE_KL1]